MSDFLGDITYMWRNLNLYSVEDDLKRIFQVVLEVYEQMKRKERCSGGSEELLRWYCRSSMEEMSTIYRKNLPKQAERVDFTNPVTQWSYTYLYMLRHVHLVYYALKKAVLGNVLRIKPNDVPLDICMIGGGPGSDILGICLLMKEYRCRTPWTNQVCVLDACTKWEYSWNTMYNLLPETFRQGIPDVQYHPFNYLDNDLSMGNRQRIKSADMITMIKSLSSAGAWLNKRQKVYEKFRSSGGKRKKKLAEWHSVYSILNHMQPGAILLFIDNKTGWQREILMGAAKYLKFDVLLDVNLQEVNMPTSFLACNRGFSKKIEWRPCSTAGDNEMIILKKPGYLSCVLKLAVPNPSRLEKGETVRGYAQHNSRIHTEGIDGVENLPRHNSRTLPHTSTTATGLANKVKSVDEVRNLDRYNSEISPQTSVTAKRYSNSEKRIGRTPEVHGRHNSSLHKQTPTTAPQRENSVEGENGATRGRPGFVRKALRFVCCCYPVQTRNLQQN